MANSDILQRDNRVSVVGSGTELDGQIEPRALEVSVGKDDTPSIRMSAEQAKVYVGGGDGTSSEGDIRINDGTGKTWIQMAGADDGNRPGSERVWINGRNGWITVNDGGDGPVKVRTGTKGGSVLVDHKSSTGRASFHVRIQNGMFYLGGEKGGSVRPSTRDGGGQMLIRDNNTDVTAEINTDNRGRLARRNKCDPGRDGLVATASRDGGRLNVNTGSGRESCTLDGADAAGNEALFIANTGEIPIADQIQEGAV